MYTPERIAKILQKLAETPEALKRNPLNRYVEGWFHITLNVREESTVLGRVVGDPDAADGSEDAPHCELTELGKAVENEWRAIGRFYPLCICEEIPHNSHNFIPLSFAELIITWQTIICSISGSSDSSASNFSPTSIIRPFSEL